MELRMNSFMAIPRHMDRMKVRARSKGLNLSALLRLVISEYLERETKKEGAQTK